MDSAYEPGLIKTFFSMFLFADVPGEAEQQRPVCLHPQSPDPRSGRGPRHHVDEGQERRHGR